MPHTECQGSSPCPYKSVFHVETRPFYGAIQLVLPWCLKLLINLQYFKYKKKKKKKRNMRVWMEKTLLVMLTNGDCDEMVAQIMDVIRWWL